MVVVVGRRRSIILGMIHEVMNETSNGGQILPPGLCSGGRTERDEDMRQ